MIYLQSIPSASKSPKQGVVTYGVLTDPSGRFDIRLANERVIFNRKVVRYGTCSVWMDRNDEFPQTGEFFLIENSLNHDLFVRMNGLFYHTHTSAIGGFSRRPYNDKTPLDQLGIFVVNGTGIVLYNDTEQTKKFEDGSVSESWATVDLLEGTDIGLLAKESTLVAAKEFEFYDLCR